MKKRFLLAIVIISVSFVSQAHSAGYGAAGCGFGGMVIKENKVLDQVGALYLNSLYFNQGFGITFGTLNCDASDFLQLAQEEQSEFVANNFASLSKEMAVGSGENLNTLAGLMGCPVTQQARFGESTRKNYETIFANNTTTPDDMLAAVKTTVSRDHALAGACVQ